MKKHLYILLLILAYNINAQNTYYVATDGDDAGAGTIGDPWQTWGKAFTNTAEVDDGDTVYFRGGVYYKDYINEPSSYFLGSTTGYAVSVDGSIGDTIYFLNYPGEVPILDCINVDPHSYGNWGIYSSGINYIKFRGLHVRNVRQPVSSTFANGWQLGAYNVVLENCKVYNIHGHGFQINGANNLHFINCDSYSNCDSLTPPAGSPGNDGTGFYTLETSITTGSTTFTNCRAWQNSDDGFAHNDVSYVELNGCWSFHNGDLEGSGNGIKLGFNAPIYTSWIKRKVVNSLFAFNRASGITTNDNGYISNPMEIYNNTVYHTGYDNTYTRSSSTGIKVLTPSSSQSEQERRIFRNNLSYDNEDAEFYVGGSAFYTHSNNTWDSEVTVTDADFASSMDSATIRQALAASRQADGSLPEFPYLKLAEGSDLIDAGVDVGLTYFGLAPDINWAEYEDDLVLCDSIHLDATGGVRSISVNSGTLQGLDTIWPSNSSFLDATFSVDGDADNVSVNQQGEILAVADGVDTVRATTQDGQALSDTIIITVTNQSAATVPTITTTVMSEIHSVQATTGGNVTDNGGAAVTAKGVCWSLTATPTISDNLTVDGTGTGAYASVMYGLLSSTWYYVRAYATNSEGTAYGSQRTVLTAKYSIVKGSGVVWSFNGNPVSISSSLAGTTYYVSNDGDDSNDGLTTLTAWETINKVNGETFAPGDKILFDKGDLWRERLVIPSSGDADAHITFASYGTGAKPKIWNSLNLSNESDWDTISATLYRSASDLDVGNMIFNLEDTTGIKKAFIGELAAQGDFWYDFDNDSVIIYSAGNPAAFYTDIECALSGFGIYVLGEEYITIQDFDIRYTAYGIEVELSNNVIIRDNEISFIGGRGREGVTNGRYGNGIEMWNACFDIYIYRNIIDQVYDAAISPQYTGGCVFDNIQVYSNIISNSEYSYEFFNRTDGTTNNVNFYNNTCINSGSGWSHDQRWDAATGYGVKIGSNTATTTNSFIKNNIFSGATDCGIILQTDEEIGDFEITNNLYYNVTDVGKIKYETTATYNTLLQWQTATSHDLNSVEGDPLFTTEFTDLSLQVGSPAINAGVDVGLTEDFDGNPIVGVPDIGAYEKQ